MFLAWFYCRQRLICLSVPFCLMRMLKIRFLCHPSQVFQHTNHITHINTKLLKDSYHHAFLMKERRMGLKLLRCVLSPMRGIVPVINSVILKARPEETAAVRLMEMAGIFPNMKPYPNNVAMPVIPLHLALPENIPLIRVLPIIPIIKNVFVMKI